ncbi:TylF/MycF/NovP-related O-methyltransferase [Streptomyces sp. NPDC059176]|uniref:TylF/MycF/NovP-related O-methyltransferase n=1 Tax=unclassified Streptomyces TaxID=2593676 RepID=UPI0036ADD674
MVVALATDSDLDELRLFLLTEHHETVDPARLTYVRDELERIVSDGVCGPVVELGCYRGAMTLWMRAVLDARGDDRPIHVFDSFEGLPDTTEEDEIVMPSGVFACSADDLLAAFDTWRKRPPQIHPGWFDTTLADGLPDRIAFGYLDGDLYSSTLVSLAECVPRLAPGGALIIDDYTDPCAAAGTVAPFPGVKAACDAYFEGRSPVESLPGGVAYGRFRRERG